MKVPKPSDEDKAWFRGLVEDLPGVEVKAMFGNLAGFVNGNMFCGLFGPDLGVRLPPDGRERLLAESGAGPFGPPERPMSEYVAVPRAWRERGGREIDRWLGEALDHTAAMPAKKPKAKKRKAKRELPGRGGGPG